MVDLAIADIHLSEKARDQYRFETMKLVTRLIKQYQPERLLVLGDLTEAKDYHPAPLVNAVVDLFYDWSWLTEVTILLGNHDYTQIDCPFFHFLRRVERISWIIHPTELKLDIGRCLFLPHTRNHKQDWKNIGESYDWIFAHNTFEGALTEHGKRLSGIPLNVLPKGEIISGDIHTPQKLGAFFTYVGAPYQVDFGDDFEPRALLLSKREYTSISLPGPQKQLIELKTSYKLDRLKINKGDIVKVRYQLTPEEQPDWINIKERITEQMLKLGITVHLVQPETSLIKVRHVNIRKAETKSDEHVMQEFGSQKKVPKSTMNVGMDLLGEA